MSRDELVRSRRRAVTALEDLRSGLEGSLGLRWKRAAWTGLAAAFCVGVALGGRWLAKRARSGSAGGRDAPGS